MLVADPLLLPVPDEVAVTPLALVAADEADLLVEDCAATKESVLDTTSNRDRGKEDNITRATMVEAKEELGETAADCAGKHKTCLIWPSAARIGNWL